MNNDQIKSLVLSAVKVAGGILIAHGATKYAAIINSEDFAGVAIAIIGLVASHFQHADPPKPLSPATTPEQNQTKTP